jgi:hypothetical protein
MCQVNTTRIGRKWELYAHKNIFPSAKLMTNADRNAPFDILDGTARINVKASRLFEKKHGRYFEFLLKRNTNCDYFLLVGYLHRRDREPVKVWLVPACLVAERWRLTIGPNHTGQWKEFERGGNCNE